MNKRLLIIIGAVCAILIILIIFAVRKGARPVQSKPGEVYSLSGLVNQAKEFEAKGDLPGARGAYLKLMNQFTNSGEIMNWQRHVEDLNIRLLFSPSITAKSVLYEIKPGDTLTKIAKEYKTTPELIRRSNNLTGDLIVPGRKIKVWNAPFNILVDKTENTLMLKTDDEIIKTYVVSTGKNNSTPAGTYKITSKLINPTWFKAGAVVSPGSPENVLGTRWLGFDLAGYGIHGTTAPQDLGKQVTQGCVRMANSDVEELYSIVPAGTEVTIVH